MKEKYDFTINYATDLFLEGNISFPYLLLRSYGKIGISEPELVVLLQIIAQIHLKNNFYPTPEEIANCMSIDTLSVKSYIASLIEKEILEVEQKYDVTQNKWIPIFSLKLLFDKLSEIWALEKSEEAEKELRYNQLYNNDFSSFNDEALGELYRIFEKEFGRLLSPMEVSQLREWAKIDNYSPGLIKEALKNAVLRGVNNFKYIDSILRDWYKNNIQTVQQAQAFEQKFIKKKNKTNKIEHKSDDKEQVDKYKDIYLNRG